jgi:hypothetical protein
MSPRSRSSKRSVMPVSDRMRMAKRTLSSQGCRRIERNGRLRLVSWETWPECFVPCHTFSVSVFPLTLATKIMGMSFTDFPNATDELIGLMGRALSPTVIAELSLALTLLSTTAGTWTLAYGWARPFYDIPLLDREQILQRWLTSRVDTRRKIVRAFAGEFAGWDEIHSALSIFTNHALSQSPRTLRRLRIL